MFDTAREHWEHEQGRFRNDFQAAYAVSSLTAQVDNDRGKVAEAVGRGLICLVVERPAYCRYTDAVLPKSHFYLVATFDNEAAALEALAQAWEAAEGDYEVTYSLKGLPEADPAPAPPAAADEDLPF